MQMHELGRTWEEQWRALIRDFMALGRCYSGQHADPDVHQIMIVFCRDCHELAISLEIDPAVPFPVRHAVRAHLAESQRISLAGSIVDPQYVGQTTIRTVSEHNPPRTIMRIDWDNPDGSTGSEDAFDFAAGAVGEWRTFLSRHRLSA